MFITFEGGDGSGKTTLIEKLRDAFEEKGHDVVTTREPGGTHVGEEVRELLLKHRHDHEMGQMAELLLFLTARAQHIDDVILPALQSGKVVLCDRFNDSSIAYQGFARGMGYDKVKRLCDDVTGDLVPDLTFFLDLDPKVGLERASGEADRFESEEKSFHEKVREGYHAIAKNDPDRFRVLDASQDAESVFEQAKSFL